MPVLTKINTNSIAEDAITGDKFAGDAYLSNTANQNISGTYSENRLYTSDAYTLSGNATVNSHLTLSTIKSSGDVVLTAGGAYTITGTGVLSGGSIVASRTDLTGMTGKLGSVVTGTPAITGVGTLTTGSIGSTVTGGSGLDGSKSGSCSFLARNDSSGWITVADHTVCGFANDSTGEGHDTDSCYETGSSRFIAPADGVYHFWFSMYCAYTSVGNGFQFSKNGTELNITNETSNKFTWHQHSADDRIINASITLTLATNDYIQIIANTACHYYSGHSCWGGCRLR